MYKGGFKLNINRYKKLLRNHFENGFSFYFILLLIFIVGIIVGGILIKALETKVQISVLRYTNSYFYSLYKGINNNYEVLKISIIFNIIFIGFVYIIGLFNLGFIIPIIIFIKGAILGFNVGYFIENFGWKGFLVSIFGVYPQYILFIPCIISMGAIAMTMTFRYKISSRKRVLKIKRLNLIDYSVFILFFSVLILFASIYEGLVSPIFFNILEILL